MVDEVVAEPVAGDVGAAEELRGLGERARRARNVLAALVRALDRRGASFGTYNVLWQIEACRAAGLPYLYLGYWIRESPKMAYKSRFMPIEGFTGGGWRRLSDSDLARMRF